MLDAGEARYRTSGGVILGTMEPKEIVHSDPDILGGTPVFVGTRVPVDALIDFLEGGDTIEFFLENYPGVKREQVFCVSRFPLAGLKARPYSLSPP
jgi:uncharacterized protein (DUF433 family)